MCSPAVTIPAITCTTFITMATAHLQTGAIAPACRKFRRARTSSKPTSTMMAASTCWCCAAAGRILFPLSLLKNNCDGTFTDVAVQAGLGNELFATQTAVWADIDNDGWIDLFVGNEKGPSQLYRNKGDGTFENISHAARESIAAPSARPWSRPTTMATATRTFFVSNMRGTNFLYHNNRNNTFTEVAAKAGVPGTPGPTLPPGSSIMTTMAGPTFL